MTDRIVLLLADTGGGHRSAAEAVAEHLRQLLPDCETEIVDPFSDTLVAFPARALFRLYGFAVRHLPTLWGSVFAITNVRSRYRRIERCLTVVARYSMARKLRGEHPIVIGSFHALTTGLAGNAVTKYQWTHQNFTFVADPVSVHTAWVRADIQTTFAVTALASQSCKAIEPSLRTVITLGSHPVRTAFEGDRHSDRRFLARARYGVREGDFVVLVSGGGEGGGRLLSYVRELGIQLPEARLMVVCGRNRQLHRQLIRYRDSANARVIAFGWVDDFASLVHAADVVVSKAGPNTIAECAAAGVPTFLTSFVPGQEAGNVQWACQSPLFHWRNSPRDLASAVASLSRQESRSSKSLPAHPLPHLIGSSFAAYSIASHVASMVHTEQKRAAARIIEAVPQDPLRDP